MAALAPLVIATKIHVPRRREGILCRARLTDYLHGVTDRRLVLVSAPAGYGKTALVVDFAASSEFPVCWYTLDPYDRDLRTFVAHLVASLRSRFPTFGNETLAALAAMQPSAHGTRTLAAVLVNELYRCVTEYFVIVLDDFHTVDEQEEINEFLSHLLNLADEHLHLIIISRTLPALPNLALLTSRGEVAGLGADDLRFTPQEVQALLRQNYGIELDERRAEQLAQAAEGWITGILLTAQTDNVLRQAVVSTSLGPRDVGVYAYLAEQVLSKQPPAIQSFLLESSVLEEFDSTLCEALLGEGDWAACLSHLVRHNLFVTELETESEGIWLRYHALLREFLQNRLAQERPVRYEALQRRAAAIYEQRQEWERSATIYQRLGDTSALASLIERVGPILYVMGRRGTLESWLAALPSDWINACPNLLMLRANLLMDRGDLPEALALYDHAATLYSQANDRANRARVLIRRATIARFQGHYADAIALCQQALDLVGAGDNALPAVAEAKKTMGICQFRLGHLQDARTYLEQSLHLYQQLGDARNIAMLHHEWGIIERATGNLDAALSLYRSALLYWKQLGDPDPWATTLNNVGVIHYVRGEYEQAQEVLFDALAKARQAHNQRIEATVLASLGDVQRDAHALKEALSNYQKAFEVAQRAQNVPLITYLFNAVSILHYFNGDLARAEEYAQMAMERAAASGALYDRAICLTTLGLLARDSGRLADGISRLTEACDLLKQLGMPQEFAWAQLHLAIALFRRDGLAAAGPILEHTLAMAQCSGVEASLVPAGAAAIPLLQEAAAQNATARRLLVRIREHLKLPPAIEKEPKAITVAPAYRLKIFAFGQARVVRTDQDNSVTKWPTAKARDLFYCLLSHPEGLRKEQIGLLFWPDHSPERLNGIFRSTMYRLRRTLFSECVVFDETTGLYRFNPQISHWYDVAEFERLLGEAHLATGEKRAHLLQQAIALYRGPFLEECYEQWCIDEQERLQARYLSALDSLADYYWQKRDYEMAAAYYQRILNEDPYREPTYRNVIRCHLQLGDHGAAARLFRACLRMLKEELRVSPSPETLALQREIATLPAAL